MQVATYREANGSPGGDMILPACVVCPEALIYTISPLMSGHRSWLSQMRAIFVAEYKNRSLEGAHDWSAAYFPSLPKLHVVVLVRVRPRENDSDDHSFQDVAVLYRRCNDGDGVYVAKALSFGTVPLNEPDRGFLEAHMSGPQEDIGPKPRVRILSSGPTEVDYTTPKPWLAGW